MGCGHDEVCRVVSCVVVYAICINIKTRCAMCVCENNLKDGTAAAATEEEEEEVETDKNHFTVCSVCVSVECLLIITMCAYGHDIATSHNERAVRLN